MVLTKIKMKRVLLVSLIAVVFAFFGFYLSSKQSSEQSALPAFSAKFRDLDGNYQSLSSFEAPLILINFWGTWCAPCREEIPTLIALQKEFFSPSFTIVGVAIDSPENAANFVKEFGVNYPILVGGGDALAVSKLLGNKSGAVPYTVLVSGSGKILWSHLGVVQEDDIRYAIKDILIQ